MTKEEMKMMIQFGANEIWKEDEYEEKDIDRIIERGRMHANEMHKKIGDKIAKEFQK